MSERTYSDSLKAFLVSRAIPHRFIEFEGSVKTVEEAAKKVPAEKIVKSIVLVASDQKPVLVILPARSRVNYKKIKKLLGVKDVRLANPVEVLEYSGYPVGGVPPFNHIQRVIMDPEVLQNAKNVGGGGEPNKLVELETRDILQVLKPIVADLSDHED